MVTARLAELAGRIDERRCVIGVIGLGYVGLPVACSFARAGFSVVGVDIDSERVDLINRGISPVGGEEAELAALIPEMVRADSLVASDRYEALRAADLITINVQTPVDDENQPDHRALESAVESLAAVIRPGALVIVESTVPPGTTMGLVRTRLEKASGLGEGTDFFLGACPERVMPGRLLSNIANVPRVCGGSSPEVAETMRRLYRTVVQAEIDVASATTAELVKVVENAYRDTQIAFANEVALLCSDLGEDVWEVRDLVNKVPFRQMHRPGGGVGGHCIPKDPWLLAAGSSRSLDLIPAARAVNDRMPLEVARLVADGSRALAANGLGAESKRVLVLGYSYLPETDDIRNSPSVSLVAELTRLGLMPTVHDPYVRDFQGDLATVAAGCGIAVIMVHHSAYSNLKLEVPLILDAERLGEGRQSIDQLWAANDA